MHLFVDVLVVNY